MSRLAPPRRDEGFTLVEVLVAILIVGTMLLVLLGVSSGALAVQETARRQQVAAGIANEVMERMRALPLSEVRSGVAIGALLADPNVRTCEGVLRLLRCGPSAGLGEFLVRRESASVGGNTCPSAEATGSLAATAPLSPTNCSKYRYNGVEYRAYAYVTTRLSPNVAQDAPYRMTVVVAWSDAASPDEKRLTILQTMRWMPRGCTGAQSDHFEGETCGFSRESDYGFDSDLKILVSECLDVPTCDSAGATVEVKFGHLRLAWSDVAGSLVLTAEVTAPITTPSSALLAPAGPTSVDVDNDDESDLPESAGPTSFGWASPGAIITRSAPFMCYACETADLHGPWELRVRILPPPESDCGAGNWVTCGLVESSASDAGSCVSASEEVPCDTGRVVLGGAVVELCRAANLLETGVGCQPIVQVDAGTVMRGVLNDQGNSMSVDQVRVHVGDIGLASNLPPYWMVSGENYSFAANAVLERPENPSGETVYSAVSQSGGAAAASCRQAPNPLNAREVDRGLSPAACLYVGALTADILDGVQRTALLSLYGLSASRSSLSTRWFLAAFNNTDPCNGSLSSGRILGSYSTSSAGVFGVIPGCARQAPALKVQVWLPSIDANDDYDPAAGKWTQW